MKPEWRARHPTQAMYIYVIELVSLPFRPCLHTPIFALPWQCDIMEYSSVSGRAFKNLKQGNGKMVKAEMVNIIFWSCRLWICQCFSSLGVFLRSNSLTGCWARQSGFWSLVKYFVPVFGVMWSMIVFFTIVYFWNFITYRAIEKVGKGYCQQRKLLRSVGPVFKLNMYKKSWYQHATSQYVHFYFILNKVFIQ